MTRSTRRAHRHISLSPFPTGEPKVRARSPDGRRRVPRGPRRNAQAEDPRSALRDDERVQHHLRGRHTPRAPALDDGSNLPRRPRRPHHATRRAVSATPHSVLPSGAQHASAHHGVRSTARSARSQACGRSPRRVPSLSPTPSAHHGAYALPPPLGTRPTTRGTFGQ